MEVVDGVFCEMGWMEECEWGVGTVLSIKGL